MSIEAWGIMIGVGMSVAVPLSAWLAMMHGKLSRIDERTTMIVEQAAADRGNRKTLHSRIDNHERRITVLEHK